MIFTLKEPSRHLRDGLVDKIIYRHETWIFVVEIDSAGDLRENLGYLGKILPSRGVDRIRHNVKGFGCAAGSLSVGESAAGWDLHYGRIDQAIVN